METIHYQGFIMRNIKGSNCWNPFPSSDGTTFDEPSGQLKQGHRLTYELFKKSEFVLILWEKSKDHGKELFIQRTNLFLKTVENGRDSIKSVLVITATDDIVKWKVIGSSLVLCF